ncbi:unnamed protein product [Effrenium voratum]|nr:unnamed protein product [Effrenium voratum]
MGLSLFSSPPSGSLFTAAATTLKSPSSLPKTDTKEETDAKEDESEHEKETEEKEEASEGEDVGDEPTGEEDEEVVFRADCKLWKLVKLPPGKEDSEGWRWQERGCGIVHINRHKSSGHFRLVMRMRGVGKLLLNTPVFPSTRYEKVGQKSVRFVGVDADDQANALCAFRLNLHSSDQQEKFLAVLKDAKA